MSMAGSEDVPTLLLLAGEGADVPGASYTISSAEAEAIETAVSMSDLKPIIMSVDTSTEETQVEEVPETVLASHLVAEKPSMKHTRSGHHTKEVYQDSESGVTYEIVRGGTRRGGDKLIDSLGFTYNLKKQGKGSKNVTYWWCSVRNNRLRCPAAVIQRNGVFMRGKRKHEHLFGQSTPKNESQYTKKRVVHRSPVSTEPSTPYRGGYTNKVNRMKSSDGMEYQLIIGGSKAGMDLLKDGHGYTYTLKKASVDGSKKHWRCSVRNKHLRCFATCVQVGKNFTCGQTEHSHLPGYNRPMNATESLPLKGRSSVGSGSVYHGGEEDDEDEGRVYGGAATNYLSYSYASAKQKHRLVRERKKKEHATFLGPSCTINLTKCDDVECNCRLVHCPFCDVHHFKPAKAGRVQDHLEMTHFAHGVQFDDLMIVKCFQDCNLERDFGHYHCVFCFQQIIKRNAYARHLLRHMRRMGIPDRLLVLPDSKFPDVINAYGFEIPICKKTTCDLVVHDRHYHCPQCQTMCRERSLTVNHLWRCLQRAQNDPADPLSDDPDEEMGSVIDESLLQIHFSHVKAFKDISVQRCVLPGCCSGKYHCTLCPKSVFTPTYRQHLIAHLVTHWKQRVLYKGYGVLKCFHFCDGIDRTMCKTRYHFHCPICAKIILTKASFEDHLKTCHMFRFGENLIAEDVQEHDNRIEEEINMTQESGPLTENVEFMEDRLTAQAIAFDAKKQLEKELQKSDKAIMRGVKRKSKVMNEFVDNTIAEMKKEITGAMQDYDEEAELEEEEELVGRARRQRGAGFGAGRRGQGEMDEEEEGLGKLAGINIDESEIFDLCSAIISNKLVRAVKSASAVKSILAKISGLSNTKVTVVKNESQYLLSGSLDDLAEAKTLLAKAFATPAGKKSKSQSGTPVQTASAKMLKGRGAPKTVPEPKPESSKKSSLSKYLPKKAKSSRKSDGTDDSFPYSEIKQIIAATKDSSTPKRGRGRPPKKSPASAKSTPADNSKSSKKAETPATPATPQGRYSTRGIRKNYVEMNSGVSIKKEPVSEEEVEASDDVEEESEEEEEANVRTRSRLKAPGKRKRSASPQKAAMKGRGSGRRVVQEEEEEEEIEEIELDHEQIEMDHADMDSHRDEENSDAEFDDDDEDNDSELDEILDEEEDDDNSAFFDDSDQELEELEEEEEGTSNLEIKHASDEKITDKTVNSLKTTNVSTSVPTVFKLGMRKVKMTKRKKKPEVEEASEEEGEAGLDGSPDTVKLKCSLCEDYTADTFPELTTHLVSFHHVYDPPRCDVCHRDFDNSAALKQHLERRHGPHPRPRVYQCTEEGCGKYFGSQNGLNGHVNRVHLGMMKFSSQDMRKKYTCVKCPYECNSAEDIYEHRRSEHDEPIQCTFCKKLFTTYASLKSHMSLKHSRTGPVTCDICFKTVSHPRYLARHKESHFPARYTCDVCNKKLNSNFSLKAHLETHKPAEERSYRWVCSYCGKRFALKANYEDHLNKHTGARPYTCAQCGRGFAFRSMLQKHRRFVHTTERPYKCGVCMKDFKFMNLLQNHMITHSNKSRHTCTACNKCFTTATTLKYHARKCKGGGAGDWSKPQLANTLILYTNPQPASSPSKLATSVLQDHASMVAVNTAVATATQHLDYTPIDTINQQTEMEVLKALGAGATATEQTVVMDAAMQGVSGALEVPVASSEEVLGTSSASGELEVYACSECNSTFGTYKEAEQHVLTAHSATQISLMETSTIPM